MVLGDWATEGPISCWKTVAMRARQWTSENLQRISALREVQGRPPSSMYPVSLSQNCRKRSPQQIREYPVYPTPDSSKFKAHTLGYMLHSSRWLAPDHHEMQRFCLDPCQFPKESAYPFSHEKRLQSMCPLLQMHLST